MLFRLGLFAKRVVRRMWVRSALFCVLALATALLAAVIAPYIPERLAAEIGANAVDGVLGVIASSMLAVATFSLATMVSAYASASATTTPRATALLIEDSAAQNALATFIGAFIFAIVGIVLLSTGVYDAGGRLVLLGVTALIVLAVVVVLLRWIEQLARLGRVHETIDRVEEAATAALVGDRKAPRFGGRPPVAARDGETEVAHDEIGYVQEIDAETLNDIAVTFGAPVHLLVRTGAFVHPARPVLRLPGGLDEAGVARAKHAIVVGPDRTFDHDPRFGVIALQEIAIRALSPAINDPGTAIDVVNTLTRVLSLWDVAAGEAEADALYPMLHAPDLLARELVVDAFGPIARDGASFVEVQVRLQKAFAALAAARDPELAEAARAAGRAALRKAELALDDPDDRARLADAALAPAAPDAM